LDRTEGICENPDQEIILAPNALGMNRFGELVETTTYFSSQGIDAEGNLEILTAIDKTHIHQSANLLIVAVSEVGSAQHSLVYDGKDWREWNNELADLIAVKTFKQLPSLLEIKETVPLTELLGSVTIYVGYQLENGTIIFNGQNPLLFSGGNALSVSLEGTFEKNSARFDGLLSTFTGKQGVDLNITSTEAVNLAMKITVEKTHVDQAASLVMVVAHQLGDKQQFFSYDGDKQRWFLWDEDFNNLKIAYRLENKLSETTQVTKSFFLKTLLLETRAGEFTLYVGYQLGDGIIVFNGLEPLGFRFSE
jgi:hypothetical protein